MSASTGTEYHDAVMTLSAEAVFIADRLNCAEEIVRRYGDDDDEGEYGNGGCADAGDSDNERSLSLLGGGLMTGSGSRKPSSAKARQSPSETGIVRRLTRATSGTETGDERNPGLDLNGGGGSCGAITAVATGSGGANRSISMNRTRQGSGALEAIRGGGGGGGWVPASHYRISARERLRLRQCQQVIKSLVTYIQFNAEFITIFGVPIDTHLRNTLFSVSVTLVGAGISAFLALVIKGL
ncbi:hypothetical protein Vretimale_19152 [Volvox reticuliferus]|nr:hypothetical protein Vretimale_19152 [Volvox reticuliferus]